MQIFDIHSHLLPGIDDGAEDWNETMKMVYQAFETGTTDVAITHHILTEQDYKLENEIIEKYEELKQRVKDAQVPMRLHLASELFFHFDLKLDHKISTFNDNKRYFLVEFPMQGIPRHVDEKFFEFVLDGRIPILAHPERNLGIVNKPERAYDFVQRGVLLQMNAGSLVGQYGEQVRETAMALLNARLIHFVGSDGHNTRSRPLIVKEAYDVILEAFGSKTTEMLFSTNPAKAMEGKEIKIVEPLPVEPPRNKRGLSFFKRLGF